MELFCFCDELVIVCELKVNRETLGVDVLDMVVY